MTQALLFDLDGTLIDSSDDLTHALNAAFAVHGLDTLSREQVEPLIGQGASALIEMALRTSGQCHLVAVKALRKINTELFFRQSISTV
jgi:phosphoglycolate phosphatase-like HAD superfamily hydrolase